MSIHNEIRHRPTSYIQYRSGEKCNKQLAFLLTGIFSIPPHWLMIGKGTLGDFNASLRCFNIGMVMLSKVL